MKHSPKLISVAEADSILAGCSVTPQIERAPLTHSLVGRKLAQPLFADRDFPPFNRATMDGYALYAGPDGIPAGSEFTIAGALSAGAACVTEIPQGCAVCITTGTMLPARGANAVIPREHTQLTASGKLTITSTIAPFQYVHLQGSDAASGNLLLPADAILDAPKLAVAATIGATELTVYRLPRILVLTTGDEIVSPAETPRSGQIRSSNAILLAAILHRNGFPCETLHCPDDPVRLRAAIADCLPHTDVLISSGGVSQGERDYLPACFTEMGIAAHFHGVAQRPGKPLWFGRHPTGKTAFGLPGNPLSTLLCAIRYVLPWLRRHFSKPLSPISVSLTESVENPLALTRFLPTALLPCAATGCLLATPSTPNTSGDMISILHSEGWIELPPQSQLPAGPILNLYPSA